MTLRLYTVSGSPFGWKVQLALAHKRVAHEATMLSVERKEMRGAAFLALNPRGTVPLLVDQEFILSESEAIVAYVEDAYPDSGPSLWPAAIRERANARRMAAEASAYVYPPVRALMNAWLQRTDEPADGPIVSEARDNLARELAAVRPWAGGFLASATPSLADYTMFPLVALLRRIDSRRPGLSLAALVPGDLEAWALRMTTLPYLAATVPPHWAASP